MEFVGAALGMLISRIFEVSMILGFLFFKDKEIDFRIKHLISIPLGLLAGFVLHLPAFWIYVLLKSDQIIKTFWSYLRLKSGKWIKKIFTGKVA